MSNNKPDRNREWCCDKGLYKPCYKWKLKDEIFFSEKREDEIFVRIIRKLEIYVYTNSYIHIVLTNLNPVCLQA